MTQVHTCRLHLQRHLHRTIQRHLNNTIHRRRVTGRFKSLCTTTTSLTATAQPRPLCGGVDLIFPFSSACAPFIPPSPATRYLHPPPPALEYLTNPHRSHPHYSPFHPVASFHQSTHGVPTSTPPAPRPVHTAPTHRRLTFYRLLTTRKSFLGHLFPATIRATPCPSITFWVVEMGGCYLDGEVMVAVVTWLAEMVVVIVVVVMVAGCGGGSWCCRSLPSCKEWMHWKPMLLQFKLVSIHWTLHHQG